MTTLDERISQFQKMAQDDPENELGHFSLGKALQEAERFREAAAAFERTIALNANLSKAYQYLGQCYQRLNDRDRAIDVLRRGFEVADARGENVPSAEMSRLLVELGQSAPVSKRQARAERGPGDGFMCSRPGCPAGGHARRLPAPPINDDLGRMVYDRVCADCWKEWLGMGVKVINEMRLDLSDERAQQVYDHHMKEFLGLV